MSTVKFSDAKTIYFQYLSEIEMNRIVSDIMFGNINEKEVRALINHQQKVSRTLLLQIKSANIEIKIMTSCVT